jgi:hypothetical protein
VSHLDSVCVSKLAGSEPAPHSGQSRGPVYTDLPAFVSLPVTNQNGTATGIHVILGQGERLADPLSGPPEHHDQGAETNAVGSIVGGAHHGDDLLNGWRVCRVTSTGVSR